MISSVGETNTGSLPSTFVQGQAASIRVHKREGCACLPNRYLGKLGFWKFFHLGIWGIGILEIFPFILEIYPFRYWGNSVVISKVYQLCWEYKYRQLAIYKTRLPLQLHEECGTGLNTLVKNLDWKKSIGHQLSISALFGKQIQAACHLQGQAASTGVRKGGGCMFVKYVFGGIGILEIFSIYFGNFSFRYLGDRDLEMFPFLFWKFFHFGIRGNWDFGNVPHTQHPAHGPLAASPVALGIRNWTHTRSPQKSGLKEIKRSSAKYACTSSVGKTNTGSIP